MSKTVVKILKYIRRYWWYLGISIVLAAAIVAMTLYLPLLTGDALDLILAFAGPVWNCLCDNEIFCDDWMPELGRFLG